MSGAVFAVAVQDQTSEVGASASAVALARKEIPWALWVANGEDGAEGALWPSPCPGSLWRDPPEEELESRWKDTYR